MTRIPFTHDLTSLWPLGAAALALGLAPLSAGAQTPDQTAALIQAVQLCTDPGVMPDDWDAAPEGWTRITPDADLRQRIVADYVLTMGLSDFLPASRLPLKEALALHSDLTEYKRDLIEDFDHEFPVPQKGFFQHDSGWLLVSWSYDEEPERSDCMISHQAPDAEAIAYLEQPYRTLTPFPLPVGRGMAVTTARPVEGGFAVTDLHVFFLEPSDLKIALLFENHPVHSASAATLEIAMRRPPEERGDADAD